MKQRSEPEEAPLCCLLPRFHCSCPARAKRVFCFGRRPRVQSRSPRCHGTATLHARASAVAPALPVEGREGSEERGVLYAPTRCVLNRRDSQQRTPLNQAGSPSLHGLSASSRKGMPRTRSEGNSVNTDRLSLKGAGVMED